MLSEKSGELSIQLPKQRTEQEVIVHVQNKDQELALMEGGRMGEQQKQVMVEDEEQEKGKKVHPESSSPPPPPQQHSPTQQHSR